MNDLFAVQQPAPMADEVTVGARTYTLLPKTIAGEDRVAISWREGPSSGVLGGYYPDREAAVREIKRRHP